MGDKLELTVFCSAIHPRVTERELFEFFCPAGDVADIRLVTDARGKSKGLCYVEFESRHDVAQALQLNGQLISGYPVTIQPASDSTSASGASTTQIAASQAATNDAYRLYFGNLRPDVTDAELRAVCELHGPLLAVETYKDPATGGSKNFAFVTFRHVDDALRALPLLDGSDFKGRSLRVGHATQQAGAVAQNVQQSLAAHGIIPPPHNSAVQSGGQTAPRSSILVPSIYLRVDHLFDAEVESSQDDNSQWQWDVRDDFIDETRRQVTALPVVLHHIAVDDKAESGSVYAKAVDLVTAVSIQRAFDKRWFDGRQLHAQFVSEAEYLQHYPDAKIDRPVAASAPLPQQ